MVKQNILFVLFLLGTLNLFAQPKQVLDKEAIAKMIKQHTNDDSPGVAVGIVQEGKIIYENYLGYANLEHQIKIDKNTRFNIASNAKQFTALCILKLIDEGKISLNDDVRKYVPEAFKNIEDKITISNLLNHTSGIRDYCDLLALQGKSWWKQFIDNDDAMELLQGQKALNFKPSMDYGYSNSNYIVLTEIIKKVTNQDFSEYAKAMFEQLEMPNTDFITHYGMIIPHKARPYGNWGRWIEEPTITEVHGDGALLTSLPDQLKWEQTLQFNNGELISKKLVNRSQSPMENSFTPDYGYGLMFDKTNGMDYTFHEGATGAFSAMFIRFPSKKTSIVVMTNNRSVPARYLAWQIAFEVLNLESDLYPANPSETEKLSGTKALLGFYKGENDGTIIKITQKEGVLHREIYQRDPDKLLPVKGGLFEYERIKGLKMNFTNVGKKGQKFTLYRSSQKPSTYYKLPNFKADDFDVTALNGRFYNDETDTEIILKFIEGNTYTLTKNGRAREAKLIVGDYLRMNSYKIKVLRDKENNIIGLNVQNRRIDNVIFKKTKSYEK